MTLGVPVPTHITLIVPRVLADLLVGPEPAPASVPPRPAYQMPRAYGESAIEIENALRDWRVHPSVSDSAWPQSMDVRGQGSFQVARRLRFLLWRYEVTGWTP